MYVFVGVSGQHSYSIYSLKKHIKTYNRITCVCVLHRVFTLIITLDIESEGSSMILQFYRWNNDWDVQDVLGLIMWELTAYELLLYIWHFKRRILYVERGAAEISACFRSVGNSWNISRGILLTHLSNWLGLCDSLGCFYLLGQPVNSSQEIRSPSHRSSMLSRQACLWIH